MEWWWWWWWGCGWDGFDSKFHMGIEHVRYRYTIIGCRHFWSSKYKLISYIDAIIGKIWFQLIYFWASIHLNKNNFILIKTPFKILRWAQIGLAGRLSLCYATLHWHDSRALNAGFPCGWFLQISTLDGYGTKPKLTLCSRIRKLSSKNTGIFRYNPLSLKAAIPYILLACQNHHHSGVAYGRRKKSVATASRSH